MVERITAFLFHAGGDDDPAPLAENAGKSFIGSYVLGMGFTFDDTDKKGVANPLSLMHDLIKKDPRNAERIFPYIGGEEVNESPTHSHHRYAINFAQIAEDEARRWPDLMAIVEANVKPERDKLGGNPDAERRKKTWWQWGRYTPALFDAIRALDRVLVVPRVSQHHGPVFLRAGTVFSEQLVVVADDGWPTFAVVQGRVHETFFRAFGSTQEERPRYTPSDCFETFPFPEGWKESSDLARVGREYYECRAALMVKLNEGLTKVYNRFHDPNETDARIASLRDFHASMDRAVLDAYGWTDIRPTCEFIPEAGDGEEEPVARKAKFRYRWPDDVRDEVLARLLALNAKRAAVSPTDGQCPTDDSLSRARPHRLMPLLD